MYLAPLPLCSLLLSRTIFSLALFKDIRVDPTIKKVFAIEAVRTHHKEPIRQRRPLLHRLLVAKPTPNLKQDRRTIGLFDLG